MISGSQTKLHPKIIWLTITIITFILFLLVFFSPLLVLYYAEEQYFIDQYKKNKAAFETVKNELFLTLKNENLTELNLVICYDSEKGRLLQHYDRAAYSVDYSRSIDANGENYSLIDKSFGDCGLSKIYVTKNYICFSEEGNNYQFIYSSERTPKTAHYAPKGNHKIHKLGGNWYLAAPH